jgi:ribonuclease HII
MVRAVEALTVKPDYLLIDGIFTLSSPMPQTAIKKGDSLSISIAAASIIAKVTRDRIMERYDIEYPQYGFSKHKGYPTQQHRESIACFGACPIHRKSFGGVKEYI